MYGFRLLAAFLVLEVLSHTVYANALVRFRMWKKYGLEGAFVLSVIGYWVLMFMWLKVCIYPSMCVPKHILWVLDLPTSILYNSVSFDML